MGFLDNIGKAISDVSQATIRKSKDVASIAKYNRMILEEEKETAKVFEQIGRKYFELHKDDSEDDLSEMIGAVRESYAKIQSYKDLVKELQGVNTCDNCGADIPEGAAFCPECGTKVVVPEPEEKKDEEGKLYCVECGAEITPGVKFCINCGTKVEYAEEILPEAAEELSETAQTIENQAEEIAQAVDDAK